ncbi:MAG: DUF3616 domain-containing protein [Myxococcota bacterium]|nr:DUF3616 domain-containing protein [Myxococcota bacterium]
MPPEKIVLQFRDDPEDKTPQQLSALVQVGEDLLLGSDEGCAIERLSLTGNGYGHHTTFPLGELLDLPGDDDEVDIEGLEHAGGCLWVAGSHSARRDKPASDDATEDAFAALANVERAGNRHLLARIPLSTDADGHAKPVAEQGDLTAARLGGGKKRNQLIDLLADDDHLAPFLTIPGKDNGFDVEGFVVNDGRVFLGLRGPVLRGHAVVVSFSVRARRKHADRLRVTRGDHDRRYTKHFLSLRGLGIRELCIDGRDLLVLAGPTMVLDGRTAIFRWRNALDVRQDTIVREQDLEHVLEIPAGKGDDHPEGVALITHHGRRGLLVAYDSPSPSRRPTPSSVLADFYPLP